MLSALNYNNQVTQIDFLGEYSALDAIQFLGLTDPNSNIQTTCDFTLYRFHYKTTNHQNSEVLVSGLMGIPKSETIKGMVSWQHGTNTYRPGSLSAPSPDEGIALASLFAGNNYLLIASDYIGLGISQEVHPYHHLPSTTNAIIDFIKIGEVVLNHLTNHSNQKLFLTGFSQGGSATAATHRVLEQNNPTQLQLIASAPIAGPYNLRNVSLPHTLTRHKLNSLVYLGYLSNAYATIYGIPLQDFIKEPYASNIPSWFDGTKDKTFMESNLPPKVTDLFLDDFYDELVNNIDNPFTLALEANESYQWIPINKLRFYYGDQDQDVIPQESIDAYHYMKNLGGNVEIINIGPYNHNQSILKALPHIQSWFNSL